MDTPEEEEADEATKENCKYVEEDIDEEEEGGAEWGNDDVEEEDSAILSECGRSECAREITMSDASPPIFSWYCRCWSFYASEGCGTSNAWCQGFMYS